MSNHSPLLALVGPTASGKTQIALVIAELLGGEIVSADSRQIYRFMDIGTAKPTPAERSRVPHHLIDIQDPSEDYSAGEFMRDAGEKIQDIRRRGKQPMLVGGSGLYVRAVIDGLFEGPGRDPELRAQLEDRLQREGGAMLWEVLRGVDPESARRCDPSKPRRIIRALEVYYTTGRTLSDFHSRQTPSPERSAVQFAVAWERTSLYRMIDARVDRMIEAGLAEEVCRLEERGYGLHNSALNTVGYKELLLHRQGEFPFAEAVSLIKRNTRRFAKRQLTWFRGDRRIDWVEAKDLRELPSLAEQIVRRFRLRCAAAGAG